MLISVYLNCISIAIKYVWTLFAALVVLSLSLRLCTRDGRRPEWKWVQSNQRNRLTPSPITARHTHLDDDRYNYVTQSSHHTYTRTSGLIIATDRNPSRLDVCYIYKIRLPIPIPWTYLMPSQTITIFSCFGRRTIIDNQYCRADNRQR